MQIILCYILYTYIKYINILGLLYSRLEIKVLSDNLEVPNYKTFLNRWNRYQFWKLADDAYTI